MKYEGLFLSVWRMNLESKFNDTSSVYLVINY